MLTACEIGGKRVLASASYESCSEQSPEPWLDEELWLPVELEGQGEQMPMAVLGVRRVERQ